ncbi:MAG TPA: hypothetical protein VNY27_12595 [Solirubrobacteraceae bacterium]|jgi:hypothetical protein|nr:hypothetical protein [Solirubrobacteraceae bacterium]
MTAAALKRLPLPLLLAVTLSVVSPSLAAAGEPPVKQIVTGHYGWEVDATTKGPVCSVASGDECQPGVASTEPGGFGAEGLPTSIAGAVLGGDIYVADGGGGGNHRVQELTASGEFVATIGWDVNKTKVKEGAPRAQRNLCTKASGDTCGAGIAGNLPGQFSTPLSVAVDPKSGDLYVAEIVHSTEARRVQKLTPTGQFVWELGREVNETTKANLCTAEEVEKAAVKCTAAAPVPVGARHPGEFAFGENSELLAAGGPEDLLYVADEHGVQEFTATGTWAGVPLERSEAISKRLTELSSEPGSQVRELLVDPAGNTYAVYVAGQSSPGSAVREFDPSGKETRSFPIGQILATALDPAGRLAVNEGFGGSLYAITGAGLHLITRFVTNFELDLAFNSNGEMFATNGAAREVVAYKPVLVGELSTGLSKCGPGAVLGSSVTLDCGLEGEVNPEGVAETQAWFHWETSAVPGSDTAKQPVATGTTPVKVSAQVQGLAPNQALGYKLTGSDAVVKTPETLTGEHASIVTPSVPPRDVGEPSVGFVRFANAVFSGRLNPENTTTTYEFQYAPAATCLGLEEPTCTGIGQSAGAQSAAYAPTLATLEATGLQPATTYRYRLFATNEHGEKALNETGTLPLPEGTFTTAPAPVPAALTAGATVTGPTSAVISGLANPDGQPASYAFEFGVQEGPATQFATVFTGSAGTGSTPVPESFELTGLQPGTTYAFRIRVSSGYGTAYGQPVTFTTPGLPSVLPIPSVLAMLAVPNVAFPTQTGGHPPGKCRRGYKRDKHGRCVKPRRKAKRHGKGARRTSR